MMRFIFYIHIDGMIIEVMPSKNNQRYLLSSNDLVIQRLKVWEFNKHTKNNNFRLLKRR